MTTFIPIRSRRRNPLPGHPVWPIELGRAATIGRRALLRRRVPHRVRHGLLERLPCCDMRVRMNRALFVDPLYRVYDRALSLGN